MELSNEPLLAQKRDSNAVTAEESASCFARWTFRWLNRVFDTGYSRQLRFEDIPPLPGREATAPIIARFSSALHRERRRLRQGSSARPGVGGAKGAPALRRVFCAQFGPQYYPLALYKLAVDALGFAGPLLLKLIVDTMQPAHGEAHPGGATAAHCYVYAAALGASVIAAALLSSRYNLLVQRVALQLRTALVGAVYEHALCVPLGAVALGDEDEDEDEAAGAGGGALPGEDKGEDEGTKQGGRDEGESSSTSSSTGSTGAGGDTGGATDGGSDSAGKIVNLMSVDTQRLVDVVSSLLELVSMPFYMCAAFWLLYRDLSFAFVGGLAVVAVIIPLNMRVAVAIGAQTASLMRDRDARMLLCTELLRAINVLKALGWQYAQGRRISGARRAELRSLRTMKFLDAVCVFLWASTPVLVTLATFGMVVRLLSHAEASSALTAGDVFAAVTLLNMLIYPMNALPWVIKGVMEGRVSAERLERFLLYTGQKPCVYNWLQVRRKLEDNPEFEPVSDEDFPPRDEHGERDTIFDTAGRSFWWQSAVGRRQSSTGVVGTAPGVFRLHHVRLGLHNGGAEHDAEQGSSHATLSATHNCFGSGRSKLIVVVGAVGSGKSSLLHALLGELGFASDRRRPNAVLPGDCDEPVLLDEARVGYVAQRPWLQAGTIRENILFGTHYDPERYARVLHACALDSDLEALSNGDMALVGERGVTLSGGQRQRLALARCAYACRGARAHVLDDVLSAVDATTAEHLWTHCVGPTGLLANGLEGNGADGAAVVLVTHALHFLPRLRPSDVVVHLEDGKISCVSERAALPMETKDTARGSKSASKSAALSAVDAVAQLVHEACNIAGLDPAAIADQDGSDGVTKARPVDDSLAVDRHVRASGGEKEDHSNAASVVTVMEGGGENESDTADAEHREEGAVKCAIWQRFASAVGWLTAAALLLSLALMQASRNASDVWLARWTSWSDAHNSTQSDNRTTPCAAKWLSAVTGSSACGNYYYLDVLIVITVANAVCTAARALLFAWGGLRAARRLHDAMLARVLEAPLAFFDTTPSGRLVNRFSRDQFCVDESLPFQLNIFLAQAFGLAGTVALLCLTVPPTLVLLAALLPVYIWLQRYYRATSRELKRLDSTTRSPIYAHFEQTLDGIVTVRAFGKGAVQRAAAHNALVLDHNQRVCFCSIAAAQWLGLRLQCIGAAVTSFIAMFAALRAAGALPSWLGVPTDSGASTSAVGLALAYALPIVGNLNGLIASFTETEKEMVSVERIHEYSRIAIEQQVAIEPAVDIQSESAPAAGDAVEGAWPPRGAVDVRALTVQYRPGLPPALQAVSLSICAREKIAIVGRTGAGKSSLLLALLRLVPWTGGVVCIDGVDVRRVPLHRLRRRVGVIAQEPVMFSGTVRSNLCFGSDDDGTAMVLDDATAWHALRLCHLDQFVAQLPHGLDTAVGTGGSGWSLGQQQLLCLGRALLRRSTLLCIDEATAAVDPHTDSLIQRTLRSAEECRCATVLTIAHRLSTVMSYDRIAVMEGGRLVECNSPAALMADPRSALSQLVRDNNND